MSESPPAHPPRSSRPRLNLSLDWLAVITALILVFLVLVGLIPSVPW
ncbi:MAG: hypothetical protein J0L63_08350 [Anaerolineae bacterium]|nr:hypothetical protein [Anaerolineae bacterium]